MRSLSAPNPILGCAIAAWTFSKLACMLATALLSSESNFIVSSSCLFSTARRLGALDPWDASDVSMATGTGTEAGCAGEGESASFLISAISAASLLISCLTRAFSFLNCSLSRRNFSSSFAWCESRRRSSPLGASRPPRAMSAQESDGFLLLREVGVRDRDLIRPDVSCPGLELERGREPERPREQARPLDLEREPERPLEVERPLDRERPLERLLERERPLR